MKGSVHDKRQADLHWHVCNVGRCARQVCTIQPTSVAQSRDTPGGSLQAKSMAMATRGTRGRNWHVRDQPLTRTREGMEAQMLVPKGCGCGVDTLA